MRRFAEEGAACRPVVQRGAVCEGSACAEARVSRTGKIKTRCMNKSNTVLGVTLGVLVAITVLTFVLMDYGDTPLLDATANALGDFATMLTQPGLGGHFVLADLVDGLFVSLALATLTTVLGAAIAFVLGLFAAMNLSNRAASNAIKAVMSLFRAVPTILWVLIFTVAIGLGPEAAVAGLLFHGIAYLTKAYSESFEEIDPGVVEALRASGASWWQVVFSAVVPEKLSEILSWTFIRFYYDIHEVGLIVYFCFAVAVALELLSTQLRKRFIVQN